MKRSSSLAGAVTVNVLFLALFVRHDAEPPPPEPPPMTMEFYPPEMNEIYNIHENGQQRCDQEYVGVGFLFNGGNGEILNAPENLPAYLAGLRNGDLLINITPIVRPGQLIDIYVSRAGVRLHFQAISKRICYK